jgi:hypothetical protein
VGSKAVDALVNGRPWTRVEDVAAALGQEAWARVGDAVTLGDGGRSGRADDEGRRIDSRQ